MFPKAFNELTLGLSDVLKGALVYILSGRYIRFLSGKIGVSDFSSFVSCEKSIICLTLSEKRTGEAAWVVAFFTEFRRVGLRYVC